MGLKTKETVIVCVETRPTHEAELTKAPAFPSSRTEHVAVAIGMRLFVEMSLAHCRVGGNLMATDPLAGIGLEMPTVTSMDPVVFTNRGSNYS